MLNKEQYLEVERMVENKFGQILEQMKTQSESSLKWREGVDIRISSMEKLLETFQAHLNAAFWIFGSVGAFVSIFSNFITSALRKIL